MSKAIALLVCCFVLPGCGSRNLLVDEDVEAAETPIATTEQCNGLDDDRDGDIDEDFRDENGRYLDVQHCGACHQPCEAIGSEVLTMSCDVLDGIATCLAQSCDAGYAPGRGAFCVPMEEYLCLPCTEDADCGLGLGARCTTLADENVCTISCDHDCPEGYHCTEQGLCQPQSGSCTCEPGASFALACALEDQQGALCVGSATCDNGSLSACEAPSEVCDERDNDCDGLVDEDFKNEQGGYGLSSLNCGRCGGDCEQSSTTERPLTCGGDPFAPSCVVLCEDMVDGLDPGDQVDADRIIANGCECEYSSSSDDAGPKFALGEALDSNCDGADGEVLKSFYVSSDGDDNATGSPSAPLKSIGEAVIRATASLDNDAPRPHIFIAAGTYVESIEVPAGVHLHGGYRRDFLELDPEGFRVDIRAPAQNGLYGGAALTLMGQDAKASTLEYLALYGQDAAEASEPALGLHLVNPSTETILRELFIFAGRGASGSNGSSGIAGSTPSSSARAGQSPRAALEDDLHLCLDVEANRVLGGSGGRNTCGSQNVSGGRGGHANCPSFAASQGAGVAGLGAGGSGGTGGMDSQGPITGSSCSQSVCCGLADFSVPSVFVGPQPGQQGGDGNNGSRGASCQDPLGSFAGGIWQTSHASDGARGAPGSGGGGGGAGGGAEMLWVNNACEFADGLGGGGGGGGAGGCGGSGGHAGQSASPSIALLLRSTHNTSGIPTIIDCHLQSRDGSKGGAGGAGGGGGLGGSGAAGGTLHPSEQSTPTLAGPFPGARGGQGGSGGSGGGGGGGCGGSSAGLWIAGPYSSAPDLPLVRSQNTFNLGQPGNGGSGGGGGAPGSDGRDGLSVDIAITP